MKFLPAASFLSLTTSQTLKKRPSEFWPHHWFLETAFAMEEVALFFINPNISICGWNLIINCYEYVVLQKKNYKYTERRKTFYHAKLHLKTKQWKQNNKKDLFRGKQYWTHMLLCLRSTRPFLLSQERNRLQIWKVILEKTILLETNVWAKNLDLRGITMMGIRRSAFVLLKSLSAGQ